MRGRNDPVTGEFSCRNFSSNRCLPRIQFVFYIGGDWVVVKFGEKRVFAPCSLRRTQF